MMFREVLSATVAELRRLAAFNSNHEVTLIRDIEGRIRIVIGTRDKALAPIPDPAMQQTIDATLRPVLGAWLAAPSSWTDDAPQPQPKNPEKHAAHLALKIVRQCRVTAPWTTQPGDPVWFLLERHTAKRAWVGEIHPSPPWSIEDVDAGTMPPVVTFFSHKGGVGRSTALVATALHLARSNRKVAVVDLDIEAPGLSSLLLASPPSVGGLDYLVEASVGVGSIARDVTAYVADADFVGSGPGLQVVPAGPVDDAFLEMLARIDLQDAGASSILAARILQLFRELQSQFGPLDFILVDARAGLHEVAGLMLAGLCHGAVVVGTDSPQSWIGITQVAQLLSAPYRREGKDPRPVLLVHGMAPAASDPRYESETRSFRTRAYDELSRFYYPTDQVPSEGERDRPHWPVVVPWTAELRGGGGLLTAPVVSALMSSPYRELTERLARLFGRPLDARGNS